MKKRRIWTSIITVILLIAAFYLTSCAPFQMAGTSKNGQPYVVQSGGVGHRMKGGVLKATNGNIVLEQILEEPDGTEIIKQISSDRLTLGLAKELTKTETTTSNNDTTVKLGEQDVQKTQIGATKEVEILKNTPKE